MGEEIYYYLIFTISGLVELFSMHIIFSRFMYLEKKPYTQGRMVVAILLYFAIIYLYSWNIIHKDSIPLFFISYGLFYFKYLLVLHVRNRITKTVPFFLFYYELLVAVLGQNLHFFLIELGLLRQARGIWIQGLEVMAAIIFAIALMALLIYRKTWNVSMWLSSLSIGQYILYILLIYIALLVQSGIYRLNIPSNVPESAIEKMSIALVLIIIIVTLQTMVIIDQRNTMEESLELVNEQMESATEHYNEMIQKDQEVKKFRHDIKNLLLVLRTLIVDDKNEKALAYMDEMQESLSKTVKKYDTGNFMADAVLNSKDTKAAEYDTSLQFDGFVPVERVKDMDMVILLSNLLDNAIEACTKLPGHKEIRIDSILKKNTWVLIVQNPTMTDAIIENNSVQTTKENKNLHGFGLKNIERVATKYDGVMQIACENSIFKTRVTMNI